MLIIMLILGVLIILLSLGLWWALDMANIERQSRERLKRQIIRGIRNKNITADEADRRNLEILKSGDYALLEKS